MFSLKGLRIFAVKENSQRKTQGTAADNQESSSSLILTLMEPDTHTQAIHY